MIYFLSFLAICNVVTIFLFLTAGPEIEPFDIFPDDEELEKIDQFIKDLEKEQQKP